MVGDLIFAAVVFAVIAFLWVALTLYLEPAPVARRISLRAMARDALNLWAVLPHLLPHTQRPGNRQIGRIEGQGRPASLPLGGRRHAGQPRSDVVTFLINRWWAIS